MTILKRNDYKYVHTLEDIGLELGEIHGNKYIIGYEKLSGDTYVAYISKDKEKLMKKEEETPDEYYERLNKDMSNIQDEIHETKLQGNKELEKYIAEKANRISFEELLI